MGVREQNLQAMEIHATIDRLANRPIPNYSWPKWLAEEYKKLTIIEREKIMENVEKELKNRKVKKVAKPEVEVDTKKKTKKVAKPKVEKKKSTSGNYKSVRQLVETQFSKNKDVTAEEILKAVVKEFPNVKYVENPKQHFAWYKSHIISRNEWVTIDPPAWSKKPAAKIK